MELCNYFNLEAVAAHVVAALLRQPPGLCGAAESSSSLCSRLLLPFMLLGRHPQDAVHISLAMP